MHEGSSPSGVTTRSWWNGRHTRPKSERRNPCRFESDRAYHMKKEPETEFDFELDSHDKSLLVGLIISIAVVGLGVFIFHKHKRKVKNV